MPGAHRRLPAECSARRPAGIANAQLVDPTFNELVPTEYRSDAMVLFNDAAHASPVFGVVVEAQLKKDLRKHFSWPVYTVTARARHHCPVVLVVITTDAAVEQWAQQSIDLGGGVMFRPFVVGPTAIPLITDPERAQRDPQLAILSALIHGNDRDLDAAVEGIKSAASAMITLPADQQVLYSRLIEAVIHEAARKAVDMPNLRPETVEFLAEISNFRAYFRSEVRRTAESAQRASLSPEERESQKLRDGEVKGLIWGLLKVITRRGFRLSEEQRFQILECTDLGKLDTWFDRALTMTSIDELFA